MRREFRCISRFKYKLYVILCILLLNSNVNPILAQKKPYRLRWNLDVSLASASLATLGTSYFFQLQTAPLTTQQVQSLNPDNIPRFDRIAVHQYSTTARDLSNVLLYTAFAARLGVFYANRETRKDLIEIGVVGYQSLFMSQALANGLKLVKRNRPYVHNPAVPMSVKTEREARFSFFSAHTTTASTICFTTAFAYSAYFPESKYNKLMWASAITIPAVEGFLRVKAGKHYPSDVITGYLVGLGTSYLMHRLHRGK